MGKNFKHFSTNASLDRKLSSPEEANTLIEVLRVLNLGALIPSSFTLALLWKLYGFFNKLSVELTKIETKIDGLKDLLPYKIKEAMEEIKKAEDESKKKKHNPAFEITDWAEVFGIAFGIMDLLIFFATIFYAPVLINELTLWILFLVPGVLGILPIIVSEKTISKETRAILSLFSLLPWVYLALVEFEIIQPFL